MELEKGIYMKKQVALNAMEEKLKNLKIELSKAHEEIEAKHKSFADALAELFECPDYLVQVNRGGVSFRRRLEDGKFETNYLDIRVDDAEMWGSRKKQLSLDERFKIEISSYSFTTDVKDKVGVRAIQLIAKVTDILLEHGGATLIKEHLKSTEEYLQSKVSMSEFYELEREVKKLRNEIKDEEVESVLKEGAVLEFKPKSELYYNSRDYYSPLKVEVAKANAKTFKLVFHFDSKTYPTDTMNVKTEYAKKIAKEYLKQQGATNG